MSINIPEGEHESVSYYLKYSDDTEEFSLSAGPVKVDGTKPVISAAGAGDSVTESSATITVAATDSLSGVAGYVLSCGSANAPTIGEFSGSEAGGSFAISGMKPQTEYVFTLTVKDYAGNTETREIRFTTKTLDLGKASVSLSSGVSFSYTGTEIMPGADDLSVTIDGRELDISSGFTFSYDNNVNAGDEASVTIAPADGNTAVTGTVSGKFSIAKARLEVSSVTLEPKEYDGSASATVSEIELHGRQSNDVVSVVKGGITASLPGSDAGTYSSVSLAGLTLSVANSENYALAETATVSGSFTIAPKAVEPEASLSFNSAAYNGAAQTPTVTLRAGGTVIPADEYDLAYSGNTNAGTATVTISAKDGGNYSFADIEKSFTITKVKVTVTADDKQAQVNAAMPALGYTVSGLIAGEALSPLPSISCSADMSKAGIYPITVTGPASSGNYEISYLGGNLYVTAENASMFIRPVITALTAEPEIKTALRQAAAAALGKTADGTVYYDVGVQISMDGGKTWSDADAEDLPAGGIVVTLPYPSGTVSGGHEFAVSHMFSSSSDRLGTVAGGIETPSVTETEHGLVVTLKGLSPVAVSWASDEYSVTVYPAAKGSVSSSHGSATAGTTVVLKTRGHTGYTLSVLDVYDAYGNKQSVWRLGGGKYAFTMPDSDVSVAARFRVLSPYESPETGDTGNLPLWMSLMALALGGLGFTGYRLRRRKEK